ncbi:uncharacterized protein F5Z01DRAFT_14725 [Emericellopsis atlantica]|uniref:Uncharacterized protein n=1 Tax=Emericellopsis atlantica TaxID=2614577 RepID=A0A9P8CTC3_9HYPO|nr:uncharacterized protein F5Z01DRAFT_14725 [Emericellopsis atlantica]KAG9259004.1 hypothetical protein F5Z01DRAFT_14725 [Emericellopsis atlantica]
MSTNRIRDCPYPSRRGSWVRFESCDDGEIWEARRLVITRGSEVLYDSENHQHSLARFVTSGPDALNIIAYGELRRVSIAGNERSQAFIRDQRNDNGSPDSSDFERETLRDPIPRDQFLRDYSIYRSRVPLTEARLAEHDNRLRMSSVPHRRVDVPASPPSPPASLEPTASPEPSASPAPDSPRDGDGDYDNDYPDSVTIAATSDSTCCDMCSTSSIERRRARQRELRIAQQERRALRAARTIARIMEWRVRLP